MRVLIYSILLSQYGVTYLDCIKGTDERKIIYGYNKATKQYSFWKVSSLYKISLIEICESKCRAVFAYKILSKGI